MRASIYTRISRDREGGGLGVATQESDCRELAATLGASVVTVHTDNDLSAYSGKPRPGYLALLDEIRAGSINVVIAWHTDRLHRSPVELEVYVAACERTRVTTQTVKAGHIDLTTASGLMVARLLGATARYEVDHAIERQRRAKKRSADAGRWKGGRRPFGYSADGKTVIDIEAAMVLEATSAVLAGGSIRGVTRLWNASGLLTTSGNSWGDSTIRQVLKRPRNAGLMEHQGEIVGMAEWPAIVPEGQWRALVEKMSNPARRTNLGRTGRKWLGSGLYLCECGSPAIVSASNRTPDYRCRHGCGRMSRRQADVDELVTAVVVARLRRPDVAELLDPGVDHEVQTLETEAIALRTRLDEMAGMFADGMIDAQQLTRGSRDLSDRLDAVRVKISQTYDGTALSGLAGADDPGAAWLNASLDRQRAVLSALATVTLKRGAAGRPPNWKPGQTYFRPELVEIKWKGGE